MNYDLIAENIKICKDKICNALDRAGRKDNFTLIGATKTMPKDLTDFIADKALLTDIGENHVQEITAKYDESRKINWHMIGQLQSNKVKYIVDKVVLIHSLDRLSLAQEIDKQAKKRDIVCNTLIELNMGAEITKGGIQPSELFKFADSLQKFENIKVKGLMSVLPNLQDKQKLIDMYKNLNELYLEFKTKSYSNADAVYMSSGMSNDYELAIEYGGANMVRLGRVLFGERNYGGKV